MFTARALTSVFRTRLWLAAFLGLVTAGVGQAQNTEPAPPALGEPASQQLSLQAGPNWVSLRVYPEDRSISSILGPQASRVLLVQDAHGSTFAPRYGVRDLDEWPWNEAVFIYALQPFALDVSGREIGGGAHIVLNAGWSRIPYIPEAPRPVSEALASILPALIEVQDDAGRAYPSAQGAPALDVLEPGVGYRVRLSEPSELVYASQAPPASVAVSTMAEAVALRGLVPGQRVVVADPVRGGTFEVRDSGAPSDGGTVFVPTEYTMETTATGLGLSQTIYRGPNADGIVFDSFRLFYGLGADDFLDATALHGHASGRGDSAGEPLLDTATGRLIIPSGLRDYEKALTGSWNLTATYRYATSARRLERVVEPITLEGRQTTDYVRPEWWGAVPYPENWTPDVSAPSGPRARASGIASGDPVYDATDRLASAINAAEAAAAQTDREHYVVLAGMYGYARVIEMQDRVVLKGEQDGVRDGQGLRVLKGAPWHYWAVKQTHVDPAYLVERSARDWLMVSADPIVVLRHGRRSQLDRVVDVELDGNLVENEYVVTPQYRSASGPSGGSWSSPVEAMLQNTPHWNGYAASHQHSDTVLGSNARLENVHVHDYGGNLVLSGEPIHFGGSRDLRLGNSIKNHHFYRVFTAPGTTVDRIEMYGYAWASYTELQQGHYRDVVFRDLVRNPLFGLGDRSPEALLGHRNDGATPEQLYSPDVPGYYFGDRAVVENLRFELSSDFRPRQSLIGYDTGPLSVLGVTLDVEGSTPAVLVGGGDTNLLDRAKFVLEDVAVEQGQVQSFSPTTPLHTSAHRVNSFSGTSTGGTGISLNPFRNGHTATFYDLGGGVSGEGVRTPEIVKIRLRDDPDVTLDVFVQRARFTSVTVPVMATKMDPTDPEVASRYRVFWRDVAFNRWQDDNNDGGRNRESGRLQYFERATAWGRTSEAAGSLASAALTRASDGARYVDVDPSMFYAPQDPSYVVVSGRDAGRFIGWENVGSKYDPVLRLSFSGSGPVTANWTAAIRPIPAGVVFPE